MPRLSSALVTFAFLALVSMANTSHAADSATESLRVVTAVEQMYDALTHDDLAKFKRHITADYFAFDGGARFTAEALVQLIKEVHSAGKIYVWTVQDPVVELYGDTALIAYTNVGSVTDATGAKKNVSWLESATLIKNNDVWRVRFFHSTRVPPSP